MSLATEYSIAATYSILSCILYFLIGYIITKNKHIFFGSYYNIILVDSAVNVTAYLSTLVPMRLPASTCKDCFLAPILPKIPFLNFFGCMWNHLPYVQCLMVLSLILNRFTAIVFPLKYKQLWKRLFIPLMLFNFLAPFVFTWPWFTVTVAYVYYEPRKSYMLGTDPNMYAIVNMYLAPTLLLVTFMCAILMVATFIFYNLKAKNRDERAERGLLIFSLVYFLVQLIGTAIMVINYLDTPWGISFLAVAAQNAMPYASDAMTFSSPYILLKCCRRLRGLLKQMILKNVCGRSAVGSSSNMPLAYGTPVNGGHPRISPLG